MIIKEENKAFPPETLVSSFSTPGFNCIISTTWDGFLNWQLTTLISIFFIIESESSPWSPFIKIIWKPNLGKDQIHKLHNELVQTLDKFGEEGKDFGSAIWEALKPIENEGLISKINELYKGK